MRRDLLPATVMAVAAIALQVGLLWLYYHPAPKGLCGDEVMYLESAMRLLAGDPEWRPELLWPSLYPRLMAGVMSVAGGGVTAIWAIQLVQIMLLGGCAVLLYDLTQRLTGSNVAALVASAWVVLYPPLVAYAHFLWPEIPHLFVFLAALWLLQARWQADGWCALAGVSLGLALLFKLLLLPFVPLLLVAVLAGKPRLRAVRSAAIVAVALAVTIAPTIHTNYRRSGLPIIADSISFNLWVGLHDTARRDFEDRVAGPAYGEFQASGSAFMERNTATWKRIIDLLAERGPVEILGSQLGRQYFRLFDKDSFLAVQLPGGREEAAGCGYHERSAALAAIFSSVSYGLYVLLLVSCPLGYAVIRARDKKWMRMLLSFFAYNLVIFLLVHVKSRYRIQFLPVFFIGSGCAVAWVLSRFQGDDIELPTTLQYLAAGGAATVLLFLAFAGPWL